MILETDSPLLADLQIDESTETKAVALITAAQSLIEKYCRRHFEVASYDEVQPVGEMALAFLDQFPVISIDSIQTKLGGFLSITADVNGSITTTRTGIRVVSFVDGVSTANSWDYADYPSIASLATAITEEGYEASAIGVFGAFPSADLMAGQYLQLGQESIVLGWDSDQSGQGHQIDYVNGSIYAPTATSGNHFCSAGPYYYRGVVRVRYQAGFCSIPASVQQVAANMVLKGWDNSGITSESLGDYSYSLSDDATDLLTLDDKRTLSLYRVRRP